jgi:zinc protease
MTMRPRHWLGAVAIAAAATFTAPPASGATKIERVVTKAGIEAWLVHDSSVPLISMDFAFRGGANQDPADKPGVGNMTAELLDEGAGNLDSKAYHERLERKAIQLGFSASRDNFRGSLRTLVENRDEAFELLRLALTAPRFDNDAVERIRTAVLSDLRRETTSPNDIASRRWWETAFPGHPYGRPARGTLESVPVINVEDMKAYARQVFARETLKVAIVGDVDAASATDLIDRVFAGLPAKADLAPVAAVVPQGLGQRMVVDLDVPQAVVTIGSAGIARKDPDFMAAFIVNHILGGGSFSSRLYLEVRERRGLAYGVRTSLLWLDYAALFMGGTATRADRTGETIEIIEKETRRLAETGPTADELAKTKSFLKGSYALAFDTSAKIAQQLVQIQLDGLGIDYIHRRAGLIDAVTLDDAKRVAKRLLDGGFLVTIVGRPTGVGTTTPAAVKGAPG